MATQVEPERGNGPGAPAGTVGRRNPPARR